MTRTICGFLVLVAVVVLCWKQGLPHDLYAAIPVGALTLLAGLLIDEQFVPGVARLVGLIRGSKSPDAAPQPAPTPPAPPPPDAPPPDRPGAAG